MPDDVDVLLRLRAVDDTKRVMDDMLQRSKEFSSQLTKGLDASATATNKLTVELAKVNAAQFKHKDAAGETAAVMKQATETVMGYAGGFLSVAGALDTVVRGYTKFAESQRGSTRIQIDTQATNAEMEKLSRTISGLSAITGKSGGELKQVFAEFREQTNLSTGDAIAAFDRIGKAANAMGVETSDTSRIAVAAINNLKVPSGELSDMFDTMAATIPSSMMSVFAQSMPKLTQELHSFGIHGKQAAEELGVAYTNIAVSLGGNARQATQVLEKLFTDAYDINTKLGAQTVPVLQRFVGDPDQVNKSMEVMFQTIKNSGYFDTNDLAARSSILQSLGMDARGAEALSAFNDKMKEVEATAARTGLTVGEVNRRNAQMATDAKADLDKMKVALDEIYATLGKLLAMTGLPTNFADSLKMDVKLLEGIKSTASALMGEITLAKRKFGFGTQEDEDEARRKIAADNARTAMVKAGLDPSGDAAAQKIAADEKQQKGDAQKEAAKREKENEEALIERARAAGVYTPPAPPMPYVPSALDKRRDPTAGFGAFATGGEFTVPGSGRGDDQPVNFMATPGERVKVESIPAAATTESLQRQQDKADLALQEHFARFRGKTTPGVQLGKDWPHDRLGNQWPPGYRPSGGGVGGSGGTGSTGGDGRGRGRGSDGKDSTAPADDAAPGLKVPTSLDPTLETGPAETVEDARKRGYIRTEGGEGGKFTDVPELKGRGPGGKLDSGALYKTLYNNVPNELIGKVPKDGARFGITTGSREEWAKLQFKLAQQESGGRTAPGPENARHSGTAGLYQMEAADLARWGQRGKAVTDPYAQIAAMNQVFKKNIIRDNAIGGQDTWPGRSNYGAGAYFGPLRDAGPNRGVIAKHEREGANISAANPAPTDAAHPASVGGFKVGDIPGAGSVESANTPELNPDGSALPARVQAVGDVDPKAFISHHTGPGFEKSGVAGVMSVLKKRGLGVEYVMDAEGNIHHTGGSGSAHFLPSGYYDDSGGKPRKTGDFPEGDPRRGLSNANSVGMEIIASDDPHVKEVQARAFAKFMAARYPTTNIYGHGEVNVGHKEKDEGLKAKRAALELREQRKREAVAPKPVIAAATPTPAVSGKKVLSHLPTDTKPEHPEHTKLYPDYSKRHDAPEEVKPAVAEKAPEPAANFKERFAAVEGKQAGGPINANTPYLVGEQGPELINPQAAGNVTPNDQLQQMMSNMREQWDRPIEPIIRPRIQQMGPLSMRWSRQSERQRARDINRDQARAAPTDQGFA